MSNLAGAPILVVAIASPKYPEIIRIAAEAAKLARTHLGADLGACVQIPLEVGESEGINFSVSHYCQPRSRWAIWRQREQVLKWLSEATRRTVVDPSPEDIERMFAYPLRALLQHSELQQAKKAAAQKALFELESGRWRPRLVMEHCDFHRGNFLMASPTDRHGWPFVIIDWGGLRMAGHAVNDLVQLARDLHLSPSQLAPQLKVHCELLKCDPQQLRYYLLSAFGYFSQNLSVCPFDHWAETLKASLDYIDLSIAKIV